MSRPLRAGLVAAAVLVVFVAAGVAGFLLGDSKSVTVSSTVDHVSVVDDSEWIEMKQLKVALQRAALEQFLNSPDGENWRFRPEGFEVLSQLEAEEEWWGR